MKKAVVVAKAVLANEQNNILLIRRSKTDERRPLQWDLPGGWVDDDEDFVTAVTREIKEETNIQMAPHHLHLIYAFSAMRESGNVCWLSFMGRTNERKIKLSYEHDKHQWTNLKQAIELIEYPVQKDLLIYIYKNKLLV